MAAEVDARGGVARPSLRRSRTAFLSRLPIDSVRRIGWGVADQGMSSASNFAMSIYVARTLGAVSFGAFSVAYVTYGFALNSSRGLGTDPLLVRFSGADLTTWRRAVAICTGTAVLVGLLAGACILVVAALLSGTTRLAFLALGLTMPGLLLQDSWRYSFFALGRGVHALVNDSIWTLTLLPALVLLRKTDHANVFTFVLAWGLTGTLAAAIGPFQARVVPRLHGALEWLSKQRDLGTRYLLEGTSTSVAGQLRIYSIGLILGLAAIGYVQAAATLMGPITVLFQGMALVTIPEAGRVLRRAPRRLPVFCLLVSTGLLVAVIAWGVVLLLVVPRGLGSWLLGPIWHHSYPLLPPTILWVAGQCFSAGASAGLHALGAARRSLLAVMCTEVFFVICGFVGTLLGGTTGSVYGVVVAAWVTPMVLWWQLHAALKESRITSDGDDSQPGHLLGQSRS